LFLTPYEIVSIGPAAGIIEMIKDACTIDSLKRYGMHTISLIFRKFFEEYKDIQLNTLSNFFNVYF